MQSLCGKIGPTRYGLFLLLFLLIPAKFAHPQSTNVEAPKSDSKTDSAQAAVSDELKDNSPATKKPEDAAPMSPEEMRQAQLAADTKKLYQLATELRAEVAKTNKDTLSLSVVKKAEEVEKLAKSIKDRMRSEANSPKR